MSKTALVVDDSRVSRMMICGFIKEQHPDWNLLESANAEEALSSLEGNVVDVMTIDMNMPGMDGLSLGAQLRERFPLAKIALVTANVQEAVRIRAQAAGLEFVPKPISKDKIAKFVDSER